MNGQWIEVARHDAPAGLGAIPRKHRDGRWYAASPDGKRMFRFHPQRVGVGAIDTTQGAGAQAYTAATLVVTYFASNPCTQSSIQQVSDFQTAYNAAGGAGQLTVDGQYGGNTQAALQEVLSSTAGAATAPQNCFNMVVPSVPALDPVTPQGTIDTTQIQTAFDWTPWLIGGGVAATLGVIGYAVWAKRHHRRR